MNDKLHYIKKLLQDVRHDLGYYSGDERIEHAFELLRIIDEQISQLRTN